MEKTQFFLNTQSEENLENLANSSRIISSQHFSLMLQELQQYRLNRAQNPIFGGYPKDIRWTSAFRMSGFPLDASKIVLILVVKQMKAFSDLTPFFLEGGRVYMDCLMV